MQTFWLLLLAAGLLVSESVQSHSPQPVVKADYVVPSPHTRRRRQSSSPDQDHVPLSLTTIKPSSNTVDSSAEPNNVMTDETIGEAVQIWCDNPTLATQYFGHISGWDTSRVTNFRALFRKQPHFNDDISSWDTSRATSMAAMFEEAYSFDQDLSRWDTANVVSMSAMFAGATSFTGGRGSLTHWNVEKVTRMDRMFQNAISFQGNLTTWQVHNVKHVAYMFANAVQYRGGEDLSRWNTSQFSDLTGMFQHAARFNGNISGWDTSEALEMDEMFAGATAFSCDLSSWNTSRTVTMAGMFRNTSRFTGLGRHGGIKSWDVRNVGSFFGMFENNGAFASDISNWTLTSARNMERMFYNATAFGKHHPLQTTISEYDSAFANSSGFKLICLRLPNAQVKVQNMFCGSAVRFDPCCASSTQIELSCCNRFCYNITSVCSHPKQDLGKANAHQYVASSGNVVHNNEHLGNSDVLYDPTGHTRGNFINERQAKIGPGPLVMIAVMVGLVMFCFWGLVKCL